MSSPARIPQSVEAEAVAEQTLGALRKERTDLLGGPNATFSSKIISGLDNLETGTNALIDNGTFSQADIEKLRRDASALENLIDDISEANWRYIGISVEHHFKRLAKAAEEPEPAKSLQGEIRAHFHSLRLRLLQQTRGARTHRNSNDLGDETELIFKEFFQRHLGKRIRVVKGGEIWDYKGNRSGQIDLMIVPDDALMTTPGDTEDGKCNVFVDQVIAAVMVGANLTTSKLDSDWKALQKIPDYAGRSSDFPGLNDHPWPLCYIIGGRSDPIEKLEEKWVELCKEGHLTNVPQFVLSLDSGYSYSGSRRWPCPRYPGNYTEPDQVTSQTGIYSGLGLAWILLQVRGRMVFMEGRQVGVINRQQALLHNAMYSIAGSQSYGDRFAHSFVSMLELLGPIRWGGFSTHAHNRLSLHSLSVRGHQLYRSGPEPQAFSLTELASRTRLFEFPTHLISGKMIVFREILSYKRRETLKSRYVVFTDEGEEIDTPQVADAKSLSDALKAAERLIEASSEVESLNSE